jgi:predicted metal-dependent phosphoesterase TrpH
MPGQLLCELHAHTTWSDGALTVPELVDLYGRSGFDVLAITDHVVRAGDPVRHTGSTVIAATYADHLAEIETEAERAAAQYDLLVIPGLELTYDDADPRRAAHALALGLRRFVGLDRGLEPALADARARDAALVAAHPYTLAATATAPRRTARFAEEPDWAAGAVDRFEVCNRYTLFEWVAERRLPVVATGDFHRHDGPREEATVPLRWTSGNGPESEAHANRFLPDNRCARQARKGERRVRVLRHGSSGRKGRDRGVNAACRTGGRGVGRSDRRRRRGLTEPQRRREPPRPLEGGDCEAGGDSRVATRPTFPPLLPPAAAVMILR